MLFCGRRKGAEREAVQQKHLDLKAGLAKKTVQFSLQQRQIFSPSSSPGVLISSGRQGTICGVPGNSTIKPLGDNQMRSRDAADPKTQTHLLLGIEFSLVPFILFIWPCCRGYPADTLQEHLQSAFGDFCPFQPRINYRCFLGPQPAPDGQFREFLLLGMFFHRSSSLLVPAVHLFIFSCFYRIESV